MREIKFRAWLLKENKMVFVDTISNNKGYGGALEIIINNPNFDPTKKKWEDENRPCDSYLNHSIQVHKDRNNGDDFVLMQYTDQKDNNVKDIYECDILESRFYKGIVVFDMGCFCMKIIKILSKENGGYDIGCTPPLYEFNTLVIVGNIYENPELLQK